MTLSFTVTLIQINLPGDINRAKNKLVNCVHDVKAWMQTNGLKLNENKTEFIIFTSKYNRELLVNESITLGESVIPATYSVRNLGAYFDNHMLMTRHVSSVCSGVYHRLGQIRKIRPT